jgi:hypothetical protein
MPWGVVRLASRQCCPDAALTNAIETQQAIRPARGELRPPRAGLAVPSGVHQREHGNKPGRKPTCLSHQRRLLPKSQTGAEALRQRRRGTLQGSTAPTSHAHHGVHRRYSGVCRGRGILASPLASDGNAVCMQPACSFQGPSAFQRRASTLIDGGVLCAGRAARMGWEVQDTGRLSFV